MTFTIGASTLDVDQTEVGRKSLPSGHGSIQILRTDPGATQELDNGERAILLRSDALNPLCQAIVSKAIVAELTNEIPYNNKPESPFTLTPSICQDTELSKEDTISKSTTLTSISHAFDCPNAGDQKKHLQNASSDGDCKPSISDHEHLVSATGFLDWDFQRESYSIATQTHMPKTSPKTSASQSSSSLPISPNISHQLQVKSCERLTSPSTESSKSTGGPSDDTLSRSILEKGLETETKSDCRDSPVLHGTISLPPLSDSLTRAATPIDSEASETTNCSLTFEDQLKQSHEETVMPFVSDHSSIPSSPPNAPIEYTQSGPCSEPATIIRAHDAYICTEVVGAQYLPSSSPPSSPSMNSHYGPSSSPLPNSSPIEPPSQISPPSSPSNFEAYNHGITASSNEQQAFYTDDGYSPYPQYSMERMYYKSPDRGEDQAHFMPAGSTSRPLTSSYPLDFYNHIPAPIPTPLPNDQYSHVDNTEYSPVQATFGTTELPISNTLFENVTYGEGEYDPIPVPQEITPANVIQYESIPFNQDPQVSIPMPQNPDSTSTNVVPRPKRSTLAGQRQQQKKLAKPFRSPVIHTPVRLAPKPPALQIPAHNMTVIKSMEAQKTNLNNSKTAGQDINAIASSSALTLDARAKHRTIRASSQFKSPLPGGSTPLDEATLVRLTPTIQSLERKLQLLRRALKVREDVQEEVLEGLVKKWSDAGREAAWEVWDAVKDNASNEAGHDAAQGKGKKRSIDDNWGWDDSGDPKKPRVEENERNWGWDVVPVAERDDSSNTRLEEQDIDIPVAEEQEEEEGEEGAPQPSLGTMLIQLGIAPETLGWDEEEGNFVDK